MEALARSRSGHFLTALVAILVFTSYPQLASSKTSKIPKVYTKFIKTSCNTTTYPSLCTKTLTPYASKVKTSSIKLCNAALNVAIKGASNASKAASKLAKLKNVTRYEAAAIKDCIEDMKDAVYELKQTLDAMEHIEEEDQEFQWANAKTWASAAISDTDSCMDGFTDRKVNANVKKTMSSNIKTAARLTSNALSLINHLY
ncbi:hypothetical protein Leryth_027324 [Lithospermum erythrorhizon]|nr:hypothetical protein Leryth_027324 [Lithospermum erythrorhizon]